MIKKNITIFGTPDNTLTKLSIAGITIFKERLVGNQLTGYIFGIPVYTVQKTTLLREAIPEAYRQQV